MGLKNTTPVRIFANIISDGSIRVKSDESNPSAVRRDYEFRDGTKGTKFEMVYTELSGIITDISFYEGEYGKSLWVVFSDNGKKITLSMALSSNYAEDFLKKLPAIDLSKEVTVKPFSFEDKKTKKIKKGISVSQGMKKITNFFIDSDKKLLYGFPEPPKMEKGKKIDSDDWTIYFTTCRKFLQSYTEENIISKMIEGTIDDFLRNEKSNEGLSIDDIPM